MDREGAAWAAAPQDLVLAEGEVHVWRVRLDETPAPAATAALSDDEHDRARAFRFPHLSRRFLAAHAALRAILARYVGLDPASLRFSPGARGKPGLAGAGPSGLEFNLSHADELALIAVVRGRRVGIDLERIPIDRDPFAAIERSLSPMERDVLRRLPDDVRRRATYVCWTRKEAFTKARGDGLALALDAFDVSCAPGDPPRLLATRGDAADGHPWIMLDLEPGGPFVGSLVVEGAACRVRCWDWAWRDGASTATRLQEPRRG